MKSMYNSNKESIHTKPSCFYYNSEYFSCKYPAMYYQMYYTDSKSLFMHSELVVIKDDVLKNILNLIYTMIKCENQEIECLLRSFLFSHRKITNKVGLCLNAGIHYIDLFFFIKSRSAYLTVYLIY